jgi:hypothetical protein
MFPETDEALIEDLYKQVGGEYNLLVEAILSLQSGAPGEGIDLSGV